MEVQVFASDEEYTPLNIEALTHDEAYAVCEQVVRMGKRELVKRMEVDAIWLSLRAKNVLKRAGIKVIGDLLLPIEQIRKLRGAGELVMNEIAKGLEELGLPSANWRLASVGKYQN